MLAIACAGKRAVRHLAPITLAASQPPELRATRVGTWHLHADAVPTTLTTGAANGTYAAECGSDGVYRLVSVPAYTNTLGAGSRNLSSGWTAGNGAAPTLDYAAGPDGVASADRIAIASGKYGPYRPAFTTTGGYRYTGWFRATSAPLTNQVVTGAAGNTIHLQSLTTTWQEYAYQGAEATSWLFPCDGQGWNDGHGGIAAAAKDILVDCQQVVIPARSYDVPFSPGSISDVINTVCGDAVIGADGYYDVTISSVIALEASTTPSADEYLWYVNATNHLRFKASNDTFVFTVQGVETATAAQSYVAGTEVATLRVVHGSAGVSLTIHGTTVTGSAQAPLADRPAAVFLGAKPFALSIFPSKIGGTITPVGRKKIRPLILGLGNSIVKGTTGVAADGSDSWLSQLQVSLGATAWCMENQGVNGQSTTEMTASAALAEQLRPYVHPVRRVVAIVLEVGNDLALQAVSTATAYANIQTVCAAIRAEGAQAIVCTAPPRKVQSGWTSQNATDLATVNASIRAGWASFADALVDLATTAHLTDPSDTAYFSDGTHPTALGHDVITAAVYATVVVLAAP